MDSIWTLVASVWPSPLQDGKTKRDIYIYIYIYIYISVVNQLKNVIPLITVMDCD